MATAKGTKQLNVGIAEELMQEFQAFVEQRGEKLRAVVEMALRRHMANPPPVDWVPPPPTFPPLPPVTAPVPTDQQQARAAFESGLNPDNLPKIVAALKVAKSASKKPKGKTKK